MGTTIKAWSINSVKRLFQNLKERLPQGAAVRLDRGILLAVFTLIGLGLLQVYTSSFIFATETRDDGLFFLRKQFIFSCLGVLTILLTAYLPWRLFEKLAHFLWGIAALGLVATFIPGIGIKAGGAHRWMSIPLVGAFEPGELLKISFPFLIGFFMCGHQENWGKYKWPLRIAIVGIPFAILQKQPDFGTLVICSLVLLSILFVFGLKWRYLIVGGALAISSLVGLVIYQPYRIARVKAVLDPWADSAGKGFQIIQSMLSFHNGGLTGVGIGEGQGKLFFLPEAHTDFTLAVLGEELGFIGVVVVLGIFAFLVLRGFQIAVKVRSLYAKIVVMGLSTLFAFQVFTNMGVAMGMLPTKGLTLPFLSYGGSSLLMMCFLFGIILNVERTQPQDDHD